MVMNGAFMGLVLFKTFPSTTTFQMALGGLGVSSFMNIGTYLMNRMSFRPIVYSIEWDMDREEFLIKQPLNAMSEKVFEHRVKPRDWVQLEPEEQTKFALYKDKATGLSFNTVGCGNWYNQGLLYYIFQEF